MSVKLFPVFRFTSALPFSASWVIPGVGAGTFEMTGYYTHAFTFEAEGRSVSRFDQAFEAALNASHASDVQEVSYNAEEAKYCIYDTAANEVSLSFGNIESARAMGFGEVGTYYIIDTVSQIVTSSVKCWHQWTSTYRERNISRRDYDGMTRWSEAYSNDGTFYAIGKSGVPRFFDWGFPMEPTANVRIASSGSNSPYVWEQFVNGVGATEPWALVVGTEAAVSASDIEAIYRLRADSALFNPKLSVRNWIAEEEIDVNAQILSSSF